MSGCDTAFRTDHGEKNCESLIVPNPLSTPEDIPVVNPRRVRYEQTNAHGWLGVG